MPASASDTKAREGPTRASLADFVLRPRENTMRDHGFQGVLLAVFLLMPAALPAAAEAAARPRVVVEARSVPGALVLADGGSVGKFLAGGRTRVVQFCVVIMCIALFIMIKKLT
jgi:hypothetical protein